MSRQRWVVRLGLLSCVALFPALLVAAEPRSKRLKIGQYNPDHQSVEMFEAEKEGLIDVHFIPRDAKGGQVMIENKSNKPLNVRLPEAFVAVPVLAQFGGGGGGMGGGGMGGGGGGGSQGMGGGMGGGGMGGGGMGGGGGMFNVAPEKVGKIKVACVCLDHGKPDPTSRMKYDVRPADTYVSRPEVIELLKMFGRGELDFASAQAATWHLNNGLSWQELAAKPNGRKNILGVEGSYFEISQIQNGMKIAHVSLARAKTETTTVKTVKSAAPSQD